MSQITIDEFNSKLLRPLVAKVASFCRLTNPDRYGRPETAAYSPLAPSHASVNGRNGGVLLNATSPCSAKPRGSDFRCLGKRKRIINIDTKYRTVFSILVCPSNICIVRRLSVAL